MSKALKSAKGKQHPVHAESLKKIAKEIAKAVDHQNVELMRPSDILVLVANVIDNEGNRVQKIKR